ncbi:non-homologous end joining protein Ku [Ancylobacter lacus]|uniref:non-homologous end joining protein Ku n=1 Tax=Ancylobacter lacus TaxID=2579970 RepID=UPI001BCC15D8|nr:Ku protein [Ancylobacter lacus]MBS7540469.1 Ku protein [Ancylobacter lacus]
MAPRSFWKGYLKLSLVTCPVAMTPATSDSGKLRFHTLNRATGNRVESRYVDAETGKPVEEDDEVKGYETGPDQYVMLEDEELEAVALESTRTIDIETFVPADSIGWIWYDRPHFLAPDDKVGEEAFSVIREAMAVTGTVGIARLVLYRRERAVLLEPRERGIVLWTLRYGEEVRPAGDLFAGADAEPEPAMLDLVADLIGRRTRDWDDSLAHDPVQDSLQKLIDARKKGRKPARPKAEPAPAGNVISIMDALKKSLAAEKAGSRTPRR